MISAGKLRWRMTIKHLVISRDAMGGEVETWMIRHANVPVEVKYLSQREKYHEPADREISYKIAHFTTRWIEGISEKHKIVFEGNDWDILGWEEIGYRRGIKIKAQLAR